MDSCKEMGRAMHMLAVRAIDELIRHEYENDVPKDIKESVTYEQYRETIYISGRYRVETNVKTGETKIIIADD